MTLEQENKELRKEIQRLKLQLRSKEQIIKSIINKLEIEKPYFVFANHLNRLTLEDLNLLKKN